MTAQPVDQTRETIVHGDYVVDAATGEVLAVQVAPGVTDEQWHVRTDEDCEWVLSLMLDADTQLAAVERQRKIILDNLAAKEADWRRRLAWLHTRFDRELRALAEQRLEGRRERHVKFAHGRLSFRRKPARVTVVNEVVALAWARRHAPQAVQTVERFLLSGLPLSVRTAYEERGVPDGSGLAVVPAEDVFTAGTGA